MMTAWKSRCEIGVAPLTADLATQICAEIDLGLLVVSERGPHVCFVNPAARSMLEVNGAVCSELVEAIVSAAVDSAPGVRPGGFSLAARVQVPGDGHLFVRTKRLPGSGGLRLITLSVGRLREHELTDLLCRRFGLSHRECQVAHLMRLGLRNEEIARRLDLSLGTVKIYAHRTFTALGVRNRAELVALLDSLASGEVPGTAGPD